MSRSPWMTRQRLAPYVFLSPFVLLFAVFLVYPLTRSLILAFQQTAGPGVSEWVGLDNFLFLALDRLFWLACVNTLAYAIGLLLLQLPIALALALLLDRPRLRGRSLYRLLFFTPHLFGGVFVGVLFNLLLTGRSSLLNRLWLWIAPGDEPIAFMSDPNLAMPVVLMAGVWGSVGFAMIYLLAALQGVDRTLYEAASVDGAGPWHRLMHVTLPGIRPVLVFLMLVNTIGALQLFELPYVLHDGAGPNGRALTIVMYLFGVGFEAGDLGYASAVGWVLVLLIGLIAWLQVRLTGFGREGR